MPNPKITSPYRPSNGSEGDWFMSKWCRRCVKDSAAMPCGIIARSMALDIGEKGYPREWVEDGDGPRCTAFSDRKPEPPNIIRDKRQIGMQV